MTLEEYKNEIKELRERLEKLEAEKVEDPQQPKRWKPNYGEEYWTVTDNSSPDCYRWRNDGIDNWSYLTSNCFETKGEAEEHKKKIEYTAKYKNYIEEHSKPIDWSNKNQLKYSTYYDLDDKEIRFEDTYSFINQGSIYASSEQIIWDAIQEIGEDNFKKYVLEVE